MLITYITWKRNPQKVFNIFIKAIMAELNGATPGYLTKSISLCVLNLNYSFRIENNFVLLQGGPYNESFTPLQKLRTLTSLDSAWLYCA